MEDRSINDRGRGNGKIIVREYERGTKEDGYSRGLEWLARELQIGMEMRGYTYEVVMSSLVGGRTLGGRRWVLEIDKCRKVGERKGEGQGAICIR